MEDIEETFENYQGNEIKKVTLKNDHGITISCLSLGAVWYEFLVPDKNKQQKNLLMNFDHCADYYSNGLCCCQSIGRVAGRIKKGQFTLDGANVQVPTNENGNTLHGGNNGFRFLNWQVQTAKTANSASAIFTHQINEDHDGFPGDMLVTITYTLDNEDKVTISYKAENGAQTTLFNPTCHAYFNLSDQPNLSTHEIKINSEKHLQLDSELIPTGKMLANANTPYDFHDFNNLAAALEANKGFDDAFVINGKENQMKPVATLREKESGRQITISSESNCLVMYTMTQEQPGVKFKRDNGSIAQPSEAVALEAQILPDAINHRDFGDIVLPANTTKEHQIVFAFEQH